MSVIYDKFICWKCTHDTKGYISFGHPKESFDFKWECDNCNSVNTITVPAWDDYLNSLTEDDADE